MEDTEVKDGSIETRDLKLATWLALNGVYLSVITPIDQTRCSFTFTLNKDKLNELMKQWTTGLPTADVRETISEYQHLVHRSKDILRSRGGMR